ncbi:hypothetical protein BJX63DRAFT_427384 [Aspergillus granulosus]|uniref:Uncharacterized protein n=1 Tax=Aspergillus granulosus TaxID=176169 RepID=A0ABR4I2Q5_9EURO
MASISDQLFLYGEVIDPEPLTGIWAILGYADLMLGGSLAFSLIVFASVLVVVWEYVLVLAPIVKCLLSIAGTAAWLVWSFIGVRSYYELSILYHAVAEIVVIKAVESPPGRTITKMVGWYFAFDKFEVTRFRIAITILFCTAMHTFFVSPVLLQLVHFKNSLAELAARFAAFWFDTYEDVEHFKAVAFAAACLITLALIMLTSTFFRRLFTSLTPHNYPTTPSQTGSADADTQRSPPSNSETEMLATIRRLKAKIRQQKARLSKQSEALEIANEEIVEAWNELAKEKAKREEAETSNAILCDGNLVLRKKLGQKDFELELARTRERLSDHEFDAMTRESTKAIKSKNEADARAKNLRNTVTELQKRLQDRMQECKKAKNIKNEVQTTIKDLTNTVVRLEEQQRNRTLNSKNKVDLRVNNLQNIVIELEQQLAVKTKESEKAKQSKLELDAKVTELEEQLDEKMRVSENDTKIQLEDLLSKAAELEQHLAVVTKEYEKARQSKREADAKVTELEEQLNEKVKAFEDVAKGEFKIKGLTNTVADLERQLSEKLNEINSLRADLQSHQSQLAIMYTSLANTEARELEQAMKYDADIQSLVDQNTNLTKQNITVALEHESLKLAYSEISERFQTALKTLDENLEQINLLQVDKFEALFDRDKALAEANQIRASSRQTESNLRRAMHDMKSACDTTIEQERANANDARSRVKKLEGEINDLQVKVGLALRDAQRSHERASKAEAVVQTLEQQLAGQ